MLKHFLTISAAILLGWSVTQNLRADVDFECGGVGEGVEVVVSSYTIGSLRALVIASTVEEDWPNGTTDFPFSPWMDSLLTPYPFNLSYLNYGDYHWNITN